jgi:putative aldouronate transport system permease protein
MFFSSKLKTIGTSTGNNTNIFLSLKRDRYLYLLILPGLLFIIIFKILPMYGLIISFQDYSPYLGISKSPWVGLSHYARFFNHPDFLMVLRNTLNRKIKGFIEIYR